ncbi:MAG: nucleotidyltransferase domain-containing protein [Nitrospirae bacterium]|nr:nucleotidyltransferase domain-containing protein [Nitrospirota bacterium]
MAAIVEKLNEILQRFNIKIAYLFGSQKQKGIEFLKGNSVNPEKGSDLDIGIVFDRVPDNAFLLYGEIYVELSDLFIPFNIDIVFLQETDSLLQYEAVKGEVIYCEDQEFLDRYEEMVMKKAGDLSYKMKEYEKDFIEAVKDGYFEIGHK